MDLDRNQIFHKLKPYCVNLSQIILTFGRNPTNGKELTKSLESLLKILGAVALPSSAFDSKLAEYVFFPLSHVFRQSQEVPDRALETSLECLTCLLESGWRTNLSIEVGKQLLILLTFLAGGSPVKSEKSVRTGSEELQIAAYESLRALFLAFLGTNRTVLTEAANVPALGHVVKVMLDAVSDGTSSEVQLSAISALEAFQRSVDDREALVSFLPGVVSSLTKTLQPKTHTKRSWRVLGGSLDRLTTALVSVLADSLVTEPLVPITAENLETRQQDSRSSWLKASAAQIKLALISVVKLRQHGRVEVRQSLLKLCLAVVEQCRQALSESVPIMIETMISLSDDDDGQAGQHAARIRRLASSDDFILDAIKSSLHGWVLSLPRVMQSTDDARKQSVISQLSISFRLLSDLDAQTEVVDDLLTSNLRDSITAAISGAPSTSSIEPQLDESESTTSLVLVGSKEQLPSTYPPVLFAHHSQRDTLESLQRLLLQLSNVPASFSIIRDTLDLLPHTTGDSHLASLWLCIQLLSHRASLASNDVLSEFTTLTTPSIDPLLAELYTHALTVLTTPSLSTSTSTWNSETDADPRLLALSLQALTLHATPLGPTYRPFLIDTLYPVTHLLASPHPIIRTSAMLTLNSISHSCNYPSTSAMMTSNADYLINAISLKLNTFDFSPAAPQVLLMMIRLCGQSLLPYLEDTVETIFSALESWHGYPNLVEVLFSVLSAITDEASKSSALMLDTQNPHRKPRHIPLSIPDAASLLRPPTRPSTPPLPLDPEPTPHRPWDSTLAPTHTTTSPPPSRSPSPSPTNPAHLPAPHSLTLRISTLTPLHLPTPSPTLRLSLLNLLSSALPTLSSDETTLLPLIHALWPAVTMRLYDPAPPVACAAAAVVAALCQAAGDFLTSRVETEWFGKLSALVKRVTETVQAERETKRGRERRWEKRETTRREEKQMGTQVVGREDGGRMVDSRGRHGGEGYSTAAEKQWVALRGLLIGVVRYVKVEGRVMDEILDVAVRMEGGGEGRGWTGGRGEGGEKNALLMEALTEREPDAVFYEEMVQSAGRRWHTPDLAAGEGVEVDWAVWPC